MGVASKLRYIEVSDIELSLCIFLCYRSTCYPISNFRCAYFYALSTASCFVAFCFVPWHPHILMLTTTRFCFAGRDDASHTEKSCQLDFFSLIGIIVSCTTPFSLHTSKYQFNSCLIRRSKAFSVRFRENDKNPPHPTPRTVIDWWSFPRLFTGHGPNPRVRPGSFHYLVGRVGSGQEVSRISRVGSGRIGSGQEGFTPHGTGRVGSGHPGSTQPAKK